MIKDIPRQTLLLIATGAVVGLWLLDYVVIEPSSKAWSAQSDRIDALQKKIARGRTLVDREKTIRDRWAEMLRDNLPGDDSMAEGDAVNAMARWKLVSGIGLPSLSPTRTTHEDQGYDEFEYRASVTGDQAALGRFIYELETDPIPVNLEDCEIAARDAHGQQLLLTARISFARLSPEIGSFNPGAAGARSSR